MPNYDHLPLRFGPDTMTTLEIPVSELDKVYTVALNHLQPIPVGRDKANRGAYAVLPTWTFLTLTWTEAAQLAVLLAQHLGLHDSMWGHQPRTSLFTRLLNGTHSAGSNPTDQMLTNFRNHDWVAHANKLLRTPNHKAENLLIERAEAADLCMLLTPIADQNPWLVDVIADTAIPEVLCGHTAHARLDFIGRRARLAIEGRAALPDAFLVS